MSERPYETAHLDEIPAVEVIDDLKWLPVRRHLGVGAFGINAYRAAEAGDLVVEDHDETGGGAGRHEEVYFVATGRAAFTVAGDEIDAPAGTFVFVRDPAARRTAVAGEAGTTVLAVGSQRGAVFEPSPWEYYFSAAPMARTGDFAGAAERVAEGLAEHGEHPSLLYNLACYEALGGRREEALAHLRRAAELDPAVLEWARSDSDLDSIRDEPGFPG